MIFLSFRMILCDAENRADHDQDAEDGDKPDPRHHAVMTGHPRALAIPDICPEASKRAEHENDRMAPASGIFCRFHEEGRCRKPRSALCRPPIPPGPYQNSACAGNPTYSQAGRMYLRHQQKRIPPASAVIAIKLPHFNAFAVRVEIQYCCRLSRPRFLSLNAAMPHAHGCPEFRFVLT